MTCDDSWSTFHLATKLEANYSGPFEGHKSAPSARMRGECTGIAAQSFSNTEYELYLYISIYLFL
jgi:hypothetical protein